MNTQYTYNALCISVYDGDSVTLSIDLGFNMWMMSQKVRLLGIDTPELRGEERADGLVAAARLRGLIYGKMVILESHKDKTGKYGRWLGTIYLDGVSMNQLLLDEGLAEPYPKD